MGVRPLTIAMARRRGVRFLDDAVLIERYMGGGRHSSSPSRARRRQRRDAVPSVHRAQRRIVDGLTPVGRRAEWRDPCGRSTEGARDIAGEWTVWGWSSAGVSRRHRRREGGGWGVTRRPTRSESSTGTGPSQGCMAHDDCLRSLDRPRPGRSYRLAPHESRRVFSIGCTVGAGGRPTATGHADDLPRLGSQEWSGPSSGLRDLRESRVRSGTGDPVASRPHALRASRQHEGMMWG